jgi:hypothetical protein
MDKESLIELEVQLKEIIRLEKVMKHSLLTQGDVISLSSLADKGIPRAQLLFAVYMLLVERNEAEGYLWLDRCKQRCNALFLLKIRMVIRIWKSEKNSYHNVN